MSVETENCLSYQKYGDSSLFRVEKIKMKKQNYFALFTPVILPLKIESPTFNTRFSLIDDVVDAVKI